MARTPQNAGGEPVSEPLGGNLRIAEKLDAWTLEGAAGWLQISQKLLQQFIKDERILTFERDGYVFIRKSELQDFVNRNKVGRLPNYAIPLPLILERRDIIRASVRQADLCGIYFLIKEDKIVYVGQSKMFWGRIAQHKDKDYDSITFQPCGAGVM